MFELETLRLIWWVLIGIILIGFALTDGFDFGAAILLPFITRNEQERQVVLDTIGPFWEGNQVWLVLGAGAVFAAWPYVYAVTFFGFYFLILLLLLTMGISRPVSFKYRSKLPNLFWRRCWDVTVFIGGLFPAVIFGILVGNVLMGIPFYFDNSLRIFYAGTFGNLFHPFTWLCGLTSLAMFVMHGGLYLSIKTNPPLKSRAIYCSRIAAIFVILFFAVGGIWVAKGVMGYEVVGSVDFNGFSNPLHKVVITKLGAWLNNYSRYPVAIIAPIFGFVGAFAVFLTARLRNSLFAFICSGISIASIIATVGISMFPFILPSSIQLGSSLLVWDASSTRLTLIMMLIAVIIFLPIILFYTSWVYFVLRGKVGLEEEKEKHPYG